MPSAVWRALVPLLSLSLFSAGGCSLAAALGEPIACAADAACPPELACVEGACAVPEPVAPAIEVFEPFFDETTGLPHLRWRARGVAGCVIEGPELDADERPAEDVALLPVPADVVTVYELTCDAKLSATTSVAWGDVNQGAAPPGFFQVALLVDGFTSGDGFLFENLLESGASFAVNGGSLQFAQMPRLRIVHGDLTASTSGGAAGGSTISAPELRRVARALRVTDSVLVPELALDSLESIGTALRIERTSGLTVLSLPALRTVGEGCPGGCDLAIGGNGDLQEVRLPALETVQGALVIDAPALTTLELAPTSVTTITLVLPGIACADLAAIACDVGAVTVDLQGAEGACAPCE